MALSTRHLTVFNVLFATLTSEYNFGVDLFPVLDAALLGHFPVNVDASRGAGV